MGFTNPWVRWVIVLPAGEPALKNRFWFSDECLQRRRLVYGNFLGSLINLYTLKELPPCPDMVVNGLSDIFYDDRDFSPLDFDIILPTLIYHCAKVVSD